MKIKDIRRACQDKSFRKKMILEKNTSRTKITFKHNLMLKCVIAP